MGSDMYMAEQSFRPKPSYAQWDGDDLVIYKDYFGNGYKEQWRGPVTDSNRSLISLMVFNIPEKPIVLPGLHERITKVIKTRSPLNEPDAGYLATHIMEELDKDTAPEREDGRKLPKPLFTKTQDKKKFVKYEDCPWRKEGHTGKVCFQTGDSCPKCGWTL